MLKAIIVSLLALAGRAQINDNQASHALALPTTVCRNRLPEDCRRHTQYVAGELIAAADTFDQATQASALLSPALQSIIADMETYQAELTAKQEALKTSYATHTVREIARLQVAQMECELQRRRVQDQLEQEQRAIHSSQKRTAYLLK